MTQKSLSSSYKWRNAAIGGGGYVTGIVLHPEEKDLVYIRTDVGGFLRWNPQDKVWIPITDHFTYSQETYYGGEAIALDPNNTGIVYIACGKYAQRSWYGEGTVFKSENRGKSWVKLNIDIKMGGNEDKRWGGERLAVDPFDSDKIFFGSRNDGIFKTTDRGASWGKVDFAAALLPGIGVLSIVFDKKIKGVVYANAYGDGIYKSEDGGINWEIIENSPAGILRICVVENGSLYTAGISQPAVARYREGLWENITPGAAVASFCGISVDPFDPEHILAAVNNGMQGGIYRSVDGGSSWKCISGENIIQSKSVPWWPDDYWGASLAALEFDPVVKNRVWFTDWFGTWVTENINAQRTVWSNYEKGHEEMVVFDICAPATGACLLSAIADNRGMIHHSLEEFPHEKYKMPLYNEVMHVQDITSIDYCKASPCNIACVGTYAPERTHGTGFVSSDEGQTWAAFEGLPEGLDKEKFIFTRITISASTPDIMLATSSGGNVWRTGDRGRTWAEVSTLPKGFEGPWDWRQPIAADQVNGNRFYYYQDRQVFYSIDQGKTFTKAAILPGVRVNTPALKLKAAVGKESIRSRKTIQNSGGIENKEMMKDMETDDYIYPEGDFSSIKARPGAEGEVWVNLEMNGIFKSVDGGKNFVKLTKVEEAHLFAFGKSPYDAGRTVVFLYGIINSTEGVFMSVDDGCSWEEISNEEQKTGCIPSVMEGSRQYGGLVFIGTNGRGIFYGVPEIEKGINR